MKLIRRLIIKNRITKLVRLFLFGIFHYLTKIIKLDPVKAILYEVARIAITQGLKTMTKSSKNTLDDEIIKPIIEALEKKLTESSKNTLDDETKNTLDDETKNILDDETKNTLDEETKKPIIESVQKNNA